MRNPLLSFGIYIFGQSRFEAINSTTSQVRGRLSSTVKCIENIKHLSSKVHFPKLTAANSGETKQLFTLHDLHFVLIIFISQESNDVLSVLLFNALDKLKILKRSLPRGTFCNVVEKQSLETIAKYVGFCRLNTKYVTYNKKKQRINM